MEPLGLSLAAWTIALVMVALGATLQATTGFGLGLVTAPVLVLLDPTLVPGVALALTVPLAVVMVTRERTDLDLALVRWAVIGRVPGAVAGTWIVVTLGSRELSLVFAASLLLAVGLSLAGVSATRTATSLFGAGLLAGMMGTATSVGGPFVALLFQDEQGSKLRTTMATFMIFGATTSLLLLTVVGEFGRRELALSAALAPAGFLGFAASRWTITYLDRGYTRPAVLTFAAVASMIIVIRAL